MKLINGPNKCCSCNFRSWQTITLVLKNAFSGFIQVSKGDGWFHLMSDLTWSRSEGGQKSSNSLFWWMRMHQFYVTTRTRNPERFLPLSPHTPLLTPKHTNTPPDRAGGSNKVNIGRVGTIKPPGWNPPLAVDKFESFLFLPCSLSSVCASVIVGYRMSPLSETAQSLPSEAKFLPYRCTLPDIC